MQIKKYSINSLDDTGHQMRWIVEKFNGDVKFLDNETLIDCFDYIAGLPYIADPEDGEYLSRPKISLSPEAKFRDCDDKAIALGCCLYRRDIPFYFVAVSEKPDLDFHHVVIELCPSWKENLNGKKTHVKYLDCTYPKNQFAQHNTFYKTKRI